MERVGCIRFFVSVLLLALGLSCAPGDTPGLLGPPGKPLAFEPLRYFEENCARCHGSYGSHYGDEFGKDISDRELCEIVDEMAAGPGGAPVEGDELWALIGFHRSLASSVPYAIWTYADERSMGGEIALGASLVVKIAGRELPATVEVNRWRLELPEDLDADAVCGHSTLIVEKEGKTTRFDVAHRAFPFGDETEPEL